MEIGVKFCGNCNPDIDISYLYSLLLKKGHKSGDIYFKKINLLTSGGKYDVILFINGCKKGCLKLSGKNNEIIVNGFLFEGKCFHDECSLAVRIIKKLNNIML